MLPSLQYDRRDGFVHNYVRGYTLYSMYGLAKRGFASNFCFVCIIENVWTSDEFLGALFYVITLIELNKKNFFCLIVSTIFAAKNF